MPSNLFANLANPNKPGLPVLPTSTPSQQPGASAINAASNDRPKPMNWKGHRCGKKNRARRKIFAALDDDKQDELEQASGQRFFNLPNAILSGTSIDNEALLGHRDHQPLGPRRASTAPPLPDPVSPFTSSSGNRLQLISVVSADDGHAEPTQWDEAAPLLGETRLRGPQTSLSGYVASDASSSRSRSRGPSNESSTTSLGISSGARDRYDVNHPPLMPASPAFGTADRIELGLGDVMILNELEGVRDDSLHCLLRKIDGRSDVRGDLRDNRLEFGRRMATEAKQGICFPAPGMSEIGDNKVQSRTQEPRKYRTCRRRGQWPDLSILEEWSHMEEDQIEERRVKNVTEPQLIDGRLRPVRKGWFNADEESPYRFTYFNEEFQSTIHSQTISELVQPGGGFRELFILDPRILSGGETDEEDLDPVSLTTKVRNQSTDMEGESKFPMRQPLMSISRNTIDTSPEGTTLPPKGPLALVALRSESGRATASSCKSADGSMLHVPQGSAEGCKEKIIRYGERPVWWLDVLSPTEPEMKVLSNAFGIHPLTAEDIMLQEAREKVELFSHYYFVNFRSFCHDHNSENFWKPVDIYVIVFRKGVLSFHFSKTPHPANVRRRIRQLGDYLILSSDWILYAIIDDITDVFQPLIQDIEDEVDEIDDAILRLHLSADKRLKQCG